MDIRLWRALKTGTLPRDLLLCGPAGTGKTFGVLRFFHVLARDNAHLRILLLRQERASLAESVLVTYEQAVLPLDGMQDLAAGAHRKNRHSYRYPSGSEIVVGGLDRATKILSTEWDFVLLNEAIEAREDSWETLFARMNRPGRSSRFGYLMGDTNPGHPGHWLKARCDAGRTVLWTTTHEANPVMFDGRQWTAKGQAYLDGLDKLTGTRRQRLRLGLWAVGEGLWFDSFDPAKHVTEAADYDPALPLYLGVDPGVHTGAVAFQVCGEHVRVHLDYLSEGLTAEDNAARIVAALAGRPFAKGYCDPAGGARNPIGPTVLDVYRKAGLPLIPWANTNPSVADSLENVEKRLNPIGGSPLLAIHPRCKALINAFLSYKRAKRADQWMDYPEDPQHPAEDLIDALRGGLYARFPMLKRMRAY